MDRISIIERKSDRRRLPDFLSEDSLMDVRKFHRGLPGYGETPLVSIESLAARLGLGGIYIKDESKRFGLNAFKALGASYAVAKILEKDPGANVFVTATDGNHGRGLAWAASHAGGKAYVFMPKGSMDCRAEAIRRIGADVRVTDMNYDDTVRFAWGFAKERGYRLVQDTAFEGYEAVPMDITRGYTTMAAEALEQLKKRGVHKPTHMFLQAGVGSMAGGVLGYLANLYGGEPPVTAIVEPEEAACVYESVRTGKPAAIGGSPRTQMAGLNCGEPNITVLPILEDFAAFFAKCSDSVTHRGMRKLAHPEGSDPPVVSGESGAVGLGLLLCLCEDGEFAGYREKIGLGRDSVVLLFSTEGDTDPENYRRIINE